MIVSHSNIYTQQKNITFVTTQQQNFRFIGILFLSGYHTLPQIKHYWSMTTLFSDAKIDIGPDGQQ